MIVPQKCRMLYRHAILRNFPSIYAHFQAARSRNAQKAAARPHDETFRRGQSRRGAHAARLARLKGSLCPFSNGYAEGVNNTVKVIKRIACGYRNFHNFRARILATVNT